jgi:hypothetical protein
MKLGITEPFGVALDPWEHQLEAGDFILAHELVLYGDKPGMGKTGGTYIAVRKWILSGKVRRILLLSNGRNAQLAWLDHAPAWGVTPPTIIKGQPYQRDRLWVSASKEPTCYVGTTIASAMNDRKRIFSQKWDLIIVDEAHKFAGRNTKKQKFIKELIQYMRTYTAKPKAVIISGSIMRRGPQDLFGYLHTLYPKRFSSYWSFVSKYCIVEDGLYGMEILGPKDEHKLVRDLADVLIYRDKSITKMPPLVRSFPRIEPTPWQKDAIEKLEKECILELGRAPNGEDEVVVAASTPLTKLLRIRQIACCPKILDPRLEDGANIEELVDMLEENPDKHMVVFTWFKDAIPHIRARLIKEGFDPASIITLQGGLSVDELRRRIDVFKRTKGIAIVSIAYAESYDLNSANWGVLIGYDWDPENNKQAEARLHRGDIQWTVNMYYLTTKGTSEESVAEVLDIKSNNTTPVYKALRDLRAILRRSMELKALQENIGPP